jgi:hypothetical protein
MPGWVVVQKRGTSDDTAVIQRAIDSLADTGGVVWLSAGSYQHKGVAVPRDGPFARRRGHLGTVVIDRDGVVHAKDFHKIP